MAGTTKTRADVLLVERGLAESRVRAQALILAGEVFVGDARVEKPGQALPADADVRVREPLRYVSRGALKLEPAMARFGIDPKGRVCADLGASTGGFTDVLLQAGAARVHAVDVGYGILHERLRADPRVVLHERTNARELTQSSLGESVDLVTLDLSFISLRLVLPAVRAIARRGSDVIALVKPQFEVGKGQVGKGGVVRDPALRRGALDAVADAARALGFEVVDFADSEVAGPAGNLEILLYLRAPTDSGETAP